MISTQRNRAFEQFFLIFCPDELNEDMELGVTLQNRE